MIEPVEGWAAWLEARNIPLAAMVKTQYVFLWSYVDELHDMPYCPRKNGWETDRDIMNMVRDLGPHEIFVITHAYDGREV